ncbi:DUF2067 domain-containing protein, partial [Roseomonas sp. NAR14]
MTDNLEPTTVSALSNEDPNSELLNRRRQMLLQLIEQEEAEGLGPDGWPQQPSPNQPQRRGFFDHLRDGAFALATLPLEIPRRALSAVNDLEQGINGAITQATDAIGLTNPNRRAQRVPDAVDQVLNTRALEPSTGTGEIVQEVGSFLGGAALLGAGGAFQYASRATSLLGTVLRGAAVGAPLDFALTDTHDDNLSAVLREAGVPIPSILATAADDSGIERRIKSMAEGAGLGVVADTVLTPLARSAARIYRAVRGTAAQGLPEAARGEIEAAARELAVRRNVMDNLERGLSEGHTVEGLATNASERLAGARAIKRHPELDGFATE